MNDSNDADERKKSDPIAGLYHNLVKVDRPATQTINKKIVTLAPTSFNRRQAPVDPVMICDVVLGCEDMAQAIAQIINDVLASPDYFGCFINRLDLDELIIDEILENLEWEMAYDEVLQTCVEKVMAQREAQEGPEPSTEPLSSAVDEKAIQRVLAIRRCLLQQKINNSREMTRTRKTRATTIRDKPVVKNASSLVINNTSAHEKHENQPEIAKHEASPTNSPVKDSQPIQTIPSLNPVTNTSPPERKSSRQSADAKLIQEAETQKSERSPPKTILTPAKKSPAKNKRTPKRSASSPPTTPTAIDADIDYSVEWKRIRSINLAQWDNHLREEFVRIGKNLSSGRRPRRRKLVAISKTPEEQTSAAGKQNESSEKDEVPEPIAIKKLCTSPKRSKPDSVTQNVAITNMSSLLDTPFKENCQPPADNLVPNVVNNRLSKNHTKPVPPFLPFVDESSSGSLSSYHSRVSVGEEDPHTNTKSTTNQDRGYQPTMVIKLKMGDDDDDYGDDAKSNASFNDRIVYDGSSCGDDEPTEPIGQSVGSNGKTRKRRSTRLPTKMRHDNKLV